MTRLTPSMIGVHGRKHGGPDTHAVTSMTTHQGGPTPMAPEHLATEADRTSDRTNKTEGYASTLNTVHHDGVTIYGEMILYMYWDTIRTKNPSSTTDGAVTLKTMILRGSPKTTLLDTAREAGTTSTT